MQKSSVLTGQSRKVLNFLKWRFFLYETIKRLSNSITTLLSTIMKNEIKIEPSRRLNKTSLSTWEVRDNRNKLVGTFDASKDKAREQFDKLRSVAEIRNIKNDLFDIRQRIVGVFQDHEDWKVCDRAMGALNQTKDAIVELDLIIDHIKQS